MYLEGILGFCGVFLTGLIWLAYFSRVLQNNGTIKAQPVPFLDASCRLLGKYLTLLKYISLDLWETMFFQ